jgi:hypothetical protein
MKKAALMAPPNPSPAIKPAAIAKAYISKQLCL